ncbi:MAG TPA: nucleotidyltransferase [Ruminococcus sp.]|nr:nucleotidyltransferase [Ruminococcus sp.]
MKISGIICEYNPIHNGHLYHIQKTRQNGATHIVAVMSGNFVQRGDVALINKFERAKTAVKCGADLVIELPVAYAMSNAETFARGAVYLLDSLGCVNEISFGSECGSLEKLQAAAQASRICSQNPELKELLENGMPYPAAIISLVEKYYKRVADIFKGANNVLAVEYLKAIENLNSSIKPFTVKRMSVGHDQMGEFGNFASASYIRNLVLEQNFTSFENMLPPYSRAMISNALKTGNIADINNLERIIIYAMRMIDRDTLADVPDVGQGLEYRIIKASTENSLENMMKYIKTKRYPMSRIRRILLSALIGIRKSDLDILPPYGRILAVNDRGTDILAEAKGKAAIPFATSLSKLGELDENCKRYSELEAFATDIYSLATTEIQPTETDYRAKIGITNMTEQR